MSASFQDVYAKHLQHTDYGYPLRMPEPMSTLPQHYQEIGLEIGDVGTLDPDGQFEVLFNICKHSNNPLHLPRGVPENFEPVPYADSDVKFTESAISAGSIHSHGIKQILHADKPSLPDYEFDTSTSAGAVLILPRGAVSFKLLSPEQFRKVAVDSALDWYEFAKKRYGVQHLDRSLYLITGFYKARSWSLGSFNNPTDAAGKILARRDVNDPNIYRLESSFLADRRHGASRSGHDNQTVFITGFKISVSSWFQGPVVVKVTGSEPVWSKLVRLFMAPLNWLRGFSGGHKPPPSLSVEHQPKLSQPFHPSDIINRFLLNKNQNARVAITHDTQWMDMIKKGLTPDDLLQEDRLGTFLTRYYTVDSEDENAVVFLQVKADDIEDSVSSVADPHDPSLSELEMSDLSTSESEVSLPSSPELDISASTTPGLEVSSCPTLSIDCPQIVITRMCTFSSWSFWDPDKSLTGIRAQNIPFGRKRFPIGFYVLVQVGSTRQRTRNKAIRLNDTGIEWEDVIFLPSQAFDEVRFTVHASFELKPMLGHGETLYTSGTHLRELVGGTCLITFSEGELGITNPGPSLLITLGRWYSTPLAVAPSSNDSDLDLEEPSRLVDETVLGQEALLRYHDEYQREDLESAVHHFECARNCPSDSQHRAVVLVNLANAKFIKYRIDPTSSDLNALSLLYDEALNLRRPGHPDRPATLLLLAQTLLFCYENQGHTQSIADKINELMSELRDLPEDTPERRAADLMLDTLERYRVVNSGNLAELDRLIQQLNDSAKAQLDGYFDKPQRLINLGTTLWSRYEQRGDRSDLEESLAMNEQALQLLPSRAPDRLPCLKTLNAVEWILFEIGKELSHLEKVIALGEEALQLISEGHSERRYWVASSKRHSAETSERSGDMSFEAQEYEEAIIQYSQAIELWSELKGWSA